MANKTGPCLEKECSWCCDPVKVPALFPDDKIPADKDGIKIWHERDEMLAPKDDFENTKLKTYQCDNLDKVTGKCKDYENRPEICRETSCIKDKSKLSKDEQHKKVTSREFLRLRLK